MSCSVSNIKLFHRSAGIVAAVAQVPHAVGETCLLRVIYDASPPTITAASYSAAGAAPESAAALAAAMARRGAGAGAGADVAASAKAAREDVRAHLLAAAGKRQTVPLALLLAVAEKRAAGVGAGGSAGSTPRPGGAAPFALSVAGARALLAEEPVLRRLFERRV